MNKKKIQFYNSFRSDINGLRALAVLAVIFNHIDKNFLSNGFLGVDIFFVISGYVITSSIYRRKEQNTKDFLIEFFQRRLKRLFPALIIFVITSSLCLLIIEIDPSESIRTGLNAILGISNISLFLNSTDYFSPQTQFNIFTHTWSLGLESQFYLIFPLILIFSGFQKGDKKSFFVINTLTFISSFLFFFFYKINNSASYFLLPFRFWEIGLGCLTFYATSLYPRFVDKFSKTSSSLSLTFLIILLFTKTTSGLYLHYFVVLLTSLLLISIDPKELTYKILNIKPLAYIGKISYSLYLWHWPIISISKIINRTSPKDQLICLLIIFIISITSFYLFEENKFIEKILKPKNFRLVFSYFFFLCLSIMFIFLDLSRKLTLYSGKKGDKENLALILNPNETTRSCDARNKKVELVYEKCIFKSYSENKNDLSIFYLGSSYAGTLSGMIEEFRYKIDADHKNLYVGSVIFPTIPINFYPYKFREGPSYHNKTQLKVEDFILKKAKPFDLIVIYNHDNILFNFASSKSNDGILKINSYKKYLNELSSFAKKLSKRNVNIIVLTNTPYFKKMNNSNQITNNKYCHETWFRKKINRDCIQSNSNEYYANSFKYFDKMRHKFKNDNKNLFFFNTFDIFCPDANTCKNSINNKIYLYDESHLNNYGGKLLSKYLLKFIEEKRLININ